MSTQQWPHTRIILFERTCQSAWINAETTPVDKKRVNTCVLKHPLFWGSSATQKSDKNPENALSHALLKSRFQIALSAVFWNRAQRGFKVFWNRTQRSFDWSINSGPNILRSCFLNCLILLTLDRHVFFKFFVTCKRTNNANKVTHYVKLGKKRRESSKRNYYIISPRVIIKAIIIIRAVEEWKVFSFQNKTVFNVHKLY